MRIKRSHILVVLVTALVVLSLFLASRPRQVDVQAVLSAYRPDASYSGVTLAYPEDGSLFPPDIIAPTFRWAGDEAPCDAWVVRLTPADGNAPVVALTSEPSWGPDAATWEVIKRRAGHDTVDLLVLGLQRSQPKRVLAQGRVGFRISADAVEAPLFYREVNLPFIDAVKDPTRIRWRFGSISSTTPPAVVLENLPVCGNCHSFPRDGSVLAMDVDYANSKGSYVMTRVAQEMVLATSDIITWNDYHPEDGQQTFGLLSQISPDGRYVVSTVKDKSVFVPKPDLAFSQLFFPIKGILCVYDRQTGTFAALPGADDPAYVQSNPTWSPDGKFLVFARSKAYRLKANQDARKILLSPEDCAEFLEGGRTFLFDLYRVPFNGGQGGVAEPIAGASHNGMSNYFARYSPDGKWIVFCRARSYMLLQPDSELYIIPAEGGTARRLECNTGRMNSWHSFSPNGKWLVFSSKANSDYTQLFLTHIDESGTSSPAIELAFLTAPDRAANIPEFVNTTPAAMREIQARFLDDYSLVRAADAFFRYGDADNAIAEYRKALKMNPDNVWAHRRLGFLLYNVKDCSEEGLAHLRKALTLDPRDPRTHYDLGMALLHHGEGDAAIRHIAEAIRAMPDGWQSQYDPVAMRCNLGRALLACGRTPEAKAPLCEALARDPNHAKSHYQLARVLAEQDDPSGALEHYAVAVKRDPRVDTSAILHHMLATHYLNSRVFDRALAHEERALVLARAARTEAAIIQAIEERIALCRRLLGDARKTP